MAPSAIRFLRSAPRILFSATLGGSLWIFLNDSFAELTFITGSSMSPTLSPNYSTTQACDLLLWRKYQPTRNLHRGDVVVFNTPLNPDGLGVKRVVALPGDIVHLDPRRRPADSFEGRRNPAADKWDIMYAQNGGKWEIPAGHIWVEGDNWRKTKDSNWYGPVSRSLVRGKAVGVVWPWREFGKKPWEGWKGRTRVIPAVEEPTWVEG